MENMRKFLKCLVVLILTACTAIMSREETLRSGGLIGRDIMASYFRDHPDFRYQGAWQPAYSAGVKGVYAFEEFVPKGESIENWTRLFTIQTLARTKSSPDDPIRMMTGLKGLMEKRCPNLFWKVISESNHDILYEYHFDNCPGQPSQHEISRILYGKWNIWRISYTQKGPPINEIERLKWIEALSEPKIVILPLR